MATIYERMQALEDWQRDMTTRFKQLREFTLEHKRLYDEFLSNRQAQEAIDAQAKENAKRKLRRNK